MSESRMDPSLAKRFRTGRACLNFAHTGETPYWVEPELVYDQASLERWLAHILGVADIQARPRDVGAAHRLRGSILQLARARAEGRSLAEDDVRTINTFAAAAPPVPEMTAAGAIASVSTSATAGLSAIARDAIDLFTGPLGHRIRVCAAEDCELLFVDSSQPGTRRWCSMQRCGNLTKLRTHRSAKAPVRDAV
ncbi:CGNR zinc finger domain-containing protein [Spongisporangium articulatum]|uniref:CGNR zinc finger domain-containing protein n=1 Tax=Spongisporangium articulatum TaxID=3362603 RepID=A0ABW8AL21_9ACTN